MPMQLVGYQAIDEPLLPPLFQGHLSRAFKMRSRGSQPAHSAHLLQLREVLPPPVRKLRLKPHWLARGISLRREEAQALHADAECGFQPSDVLRREQAPVLPDVQQ